MSEETGKRRADEESDLFSTRPYDSGTSIPRIDKVPLTKEELRKRKLLRVAYAIVAVLSLVLAAWLYVHLSHLAEVEAAVEAASDDGRVATLRAALALVETDEGAEARALALRLRAMLVLAGESEDMDAIASALRTLPSDDGDVARERGIAETYLALARGELAVAMETASAVVAHGDYAAEAARARALAVFSVGNGEQALAAAQIAIDQRPEAPRHAAFFAELMAHAGQTQQALARLDEVPEARRNAATLIARARIMDRAGAELPRVAELARTVLDDEVATVHEKAWARLLLARASAAAGDRVTARRHLDEAAEGAPPGDELFTLALSEAALRIDADHLAQQVARRLPSPLSVDAPRRAQLSAELALAGHDLRAAEDALVHAPAGARTALAQGRLLEARGQIDRARQLYLEAAGEPAFRVPATVQLAAMELAQGSAREAMDRITPLLGEHPHHPDVVPVAVEAELGLRAPERAMALVAPALERHPSDVRLLAAKGHVEMALEQWEGALGTLDEALRIQQDDADLHADRGRAARQLSRLEVAREAFDEALRLSAGHPVALVGRLELDLLDFRAAEGRSILDRIDRAEVQSLAVERLRGRLLAMEIAGQSGVATLRRALQAHPADASLTMSLGWLYMQAEQYTSALRTFGRGAEAAPVEVTLARTLAQIRMHASAPARAVIEAMVATLDEASLEASVRAELHAVLGRLAQVDDNRPLARREAQAALEIDPRNAEAHLLLAEVSEDEVSNTGMLETALVGLHPSSRPLAVLAIREEQVTATACAFAGRYRRAAPAGQYIRAVGRVLRDCRRQGTR